MIKRVTDLIRMYAGIQYFEDITDIPDPDVRMMAQCFTPDKIVVNQLGRIIKIIGHTQGGSRIEITR